MKQNRNLVLVCATALLTLASPSHADPTDPSQRSGTSGVGGSAKVNLLSGTFNLALEQTTYARAVLYYPDAGLSSALSIAASGLLRFTDTLKPDEKIGLLVRLFGPEGLMPQEEFISVLKATKDNEDPSVQQVAQIKDEAASTLKAFLTRVAEKKASARDRVATLALLGDIGAFMTSTGATTGTKRSQVMTQKLQAAFTTYVLSLEVNKGKHPDDLKRSVLAAKQAGGSDTVAPLKSNERTRADIPGARTGIHNTGALVDAAGGIPQKDAILGSLWALALIDSSRVSTITEPLAGHMSASPSEILHTWDLLSGRPIDSAFLGKFKTVQEKAELDDRAAGASAFLIACGYHSALEVLDGIMTYLGQPPRHILDKTTLEGKKIGDAGNLFYEDAATKLIIELLEGNVDKKAPLQPKAWFIKALTSVPGGVDGYVSLAKDANEYTVGFVNPKWTAFVKVSDVEGRLKDGKAPKLHCLIGTDECTVTRVAIQSGSSAGTATIKTNGLKVKYGTNTPVIFHGE